MESVIVIIRHYLYLIGVITGCGVKRGAEPDVGGERNMRPYFIVNQGTRPVAAVTSGGELAQVAVGPGNDDNGREDGPAPVTDTGDDRGDNDAVQARGSGRVRRRSMRRK